MKSLKQIVKTSITDNNIVMQSIITANYQPMLLGKV